jgi:hypothetical protein
LPVFPAKVDHVLLYLVAGVISRIKDEFMSSSVTVYRKAPQIDQLFQIFADSGSNQAQIRYFSETNTVVSVIRNLVQENAALVNIVGNLWKTHQYNQEYISYLLGSYSKEEFITIANAFAEQLQNDISDEYLALASNVVFAAIKQPLTSSDLSIFLDIDSVAINNKMLALGYNPDVSESE